MRISDWSSDVCSSDLLGSNRTLVLVDGRRTVSNSGISNLVSLSTIPSDFIDRVEIITGGTSSVYGSDAVAGVVNIITKKNERGLTLRARAGLPAQGDGQELTPGATRSEERRGGKGGAMTGRWGWSPRH